MKKIIFLAHDPGGYDVVFPVAQKFQLDNIPAKLFCTGPAAQLEHLNSISVTEVKHTIQYLIENKRIAGLVTGTSWGTNLELQVIDICKQAQIPTIAILDYWSNYQKRFICESGEAIYPDFFIVMDEFARREAIQAGVPVTIIKVLGHPGLDKYVAIQKAKRCTKINNKKILFLSQPLSALYGDDLGYTEESALAECRQVIANFGSFILKVKFHPKDKPGHKQYYADLAVDGNLIDILPEYDLVIGMSTMGLLHAVLMGIPAISYQPNLKKPDQCITNKLGLSTLVDSYQKLQQLIKGASFDGQVMNNRTLSQKLIWLDGRSTERVAGFIREVFLREV